MQNNTELNVLISIKRLILAKNHQIDHYGRQIHGKRHYRCNSLYGDLLPSHHDHHNNRLYMRLKNVSPTKPT